MIQNLVRLPYCQKITAMKPSSAIRPLTFLKAHTAEVIREVNDTRDTIIITQNGRPKAVLQDISTYEQNQETMALLKLLAQGRRSAKEGRSNPLRQVIQRLQADLAKSEA